MARGFKSLLDAADVCVVGQLGAVLGLQAEVILLGFDQLLQLQAFLAHGLGQFVDGVEQLSNARRLLER
nr:hypothetical protein [Halomonas elongata]